MTARTVTAIRGSAGPDDWRQASACTPRSPAMIGHRRLYYPYDWILFRCRTNTWFGATGMALSCLVDCRTRVAATADPFTTEPAAANDALVMDRRISRDTSLRLARNYAAYTVRQKHKALVLPQIEVVERRSVHKPFWVVEYQSHKGDRQELLVDGLTGEYCALPAGCAAVQSPVRITANRARSVVPWGERSSSDTTNMVPNAATTE